MKSEFEGIRILYQGIMLPPLLDILILLPRLYNFNHNINLFIQTKYLIKYSFVMILKYLLISKLYRDFLRGTLRDSHASLSCFVYLSVLFIS
jgi:hypothetical protein